MIKVQYEQLVSRSKEIAINFFVNKHAKSIFDERRKNEKLSPGQKRDWTPAKIAFWPRAKQLAYIQKYRYLIDDYKGIKTIFEEELEKRKTHIASIAIQGKYAIIRGCRIRFISYLNNRKQIPDGVYFLWKKQRGYRLKGSHFRSKNIKPPMDDGFFTWGGPTGGSRRTAWHKTARCVVHLNRIIWLERRTCWEDNFDWLKF